MGNKKLKIGILDSGKGGHYALLDIKSHFPQYDYETYLDHANAPYGNKSSDEIFRLTEVGCKELWKKGCKLILIACNTISAETLRKLQEKYITLPLDKGELEGVGRKILGCIIPSVEIAVEISEGKIGLLATRFTINSGKYEREIAKISSTHTLFPLEAPELAGFVEQGMADHRYTLQYLERRIETLLKHDIDTIILGCTHYTVFYEYITKHYPQLKIVDSARTQTIKLAGYLERHPELFV